MHRLFGRGFIVDCIFEDWKQAIAQCLGSLEHETKFHLMPAAHVKCYFNQ